MPGILPSLAPRNACPSSTSKESGSGARGIANLPNTPWRGPSCLVRCQEKDRPRSIKNGLLPESARNTSNRANGGWPLVA